MDLSKEDADKRNSLPYPMELGSPAFAPIVVEKEKDIILNAGKIHAKQEYDRIMEQVEVLKRQAESLMNRMAVSELMHDCVYGFKPVHGRTYYVYYDSIKNINWLSINHPESWSALALHHRFVMTVRLMGDSTWEEVIDET
jgi:hypothetical protein